MPKYPEITAKLVGTDSNGFFLASRVRMALKKGGVSKEEQEKFFDEALSGNYNHLLTTCMEWVNVE